MKNAKGQKGPVRGSTELEIKRLQLATFTEIGKALTSSRDLKEILNVVMEEIRDLLQPKNWSLLLLDESKDEVRFELAVGEGADKIKDLRLKVGEGVAGWVAREMKPLLVPDVSKDPRFCRKADEVSHFTTQSIICVPLTTRGRCLGVIELINKVEDPAGFSEDDLLVLTTLADFTAIAIERDLLPNLAKYYKPSPHSYRRLPSSSLMCSRGCNGTCTFCARPFMGEKYRAHSAEYTVAMVDHLVKVYGIKDIMFYDDNFLLDKKRVTAICDALLKKDYTISWSCLARPEVTSVDLFGLIKKAGC